MATVTTPTRSRNITESHRRVRSPLERLRGYIRSYVSIEGLTVLLIFLALWFWIGYLIDYGFFRLFGIDFVQELHWGFRAGTLIILISAGLALAAVKVLTRLFKEFRDAALALVLERRFPKELGDRLITAVELADTKQAAKQGYSVAMIEETVHDAAERVGKLPVQQVFDWKRLYRLGSIVLILSLGVYVLTGGLFTGLDAATTNRTNLGGFSGFHETAGIWLERNILLRNIIWPRRAYLVVVGYPEKGIKVGRDDPAPTIRVRALEYVIAGAPSSRARAAYSEWLTSRHEPDEDARAKLAAFAAEPAEGWRPLTWFDLTPDLLAAPPPEVALPDDWQPRDGEFGLSLDQIKIILGKTETHQALNADLKDKLRDLFEQLDLRAADPKMRRTLRKLVIPSEVILSHKGKTNSGQKPMTAGSDNEFTAQLTDLKDPGEMPWKFTFSVRGEDYYTPDLPIMVMAPPYLVELQSHEERPAYLFYRLAEAKPEEIKELRDLRQFMAPQDILQNGSDTSKFDVPAGTNVEIVATAKDPLKQVVIEPRKAGGVVKADLVEPIDPQRDPSSGVTSFRSFRVRFNNVRDEIGFILKMTDVDGIVGTRSVIIKAKEDFAPDLGDVRLETMFEQPVLRKSKEGFYLVTPSARLSFQGSVKDDVGLAELGYAYTLDKVDPPGTISVETALGVPVVSLMAPGGHNQIMAAAYLTLAAKAPKATKSPVKEIQRVDMPRFKQHVLEHVAYTSEKELSADRRDLAHEFLPLARIKELAKQPQKPPYRSLLKEFTIDVDVWLQAERDPVRCDFPLWKANLKTPEDKGAQQRYKMQLWLEATDGDLLSDKDPKDGSPRPHVGKSKELFTFLIVGESELLSEIAKEQEERYAKLDKQTTEIVETDARLNKIYVDLAGNPEAVALLNISASAEEVDRTLGKSLEEVQKEVNNYLRIVREMKINQVEASKISDTERDVIKPLESICKNDFPEASKAVAKFREQIDRPDVPVAARVAQARIDGKVAQEKVQALLAKLQDVLGKLQGAIIIEKEIAKLRKIYEEEEAQRVTMESLKKYLEEIILKGVLDSKP
jgi:hypothetical protein